MRKQIGLRMKDETRDQLERVRGGLSRTDYIEGAVLAQIARDKCRISGFDTEKARIVSMGTVVDGKATGWVMDGGNYPGLTISADGSELLGGWTIQELERIAELVDSIKQGSVERKGIDPSDYGLLPVPTGFMEITHHRVRPSAESKSGVLPVPKKAQKGHK